MIVFGPVFHHKQLLKKISLQTPFQSCAHSNQRKKISDTTERKTLKYILLFCLKVKLN